MNEGESHREVASHKGSDETDLVVLRHADMSC